MLVDDLLQANECAGYDWRKTRRKDLVYHSETYLRGGKFYFIVEVPGVSNPFLIYHADKKDWGIYYEYQSFKTLEEAKENIPK